MPQLFHRSANTLAKVIIALLLLIVGGFFWLIYSLNASPYFTRVGVPREQPVQFSHRHHVSDDGIDCRYCHTSVETSPFAGIPPTHVCMTCHSQIWSESAELAPVRESYRTNRPIQWTRVYDLPDFVYFNHSIHIKKGIGCATCHGPVDQMPLLWRHTKLTMAWCLDCHRSPELYVRPREFVFDMNWRPAEDQVLLGRRLVKEYDIRSRTDCYTCHR